MDWLNYHHLHYFWTVARLGSIVAAAQELRVSQPTISGQIKELEQSLGERLFMRSGRRLVLSEVGRTVFTYAQEIFNLGRELMDSVKQRPTGRPQRLAVGIADVISKLVARRLLEPATSIPLRLVCREDSVENLLTELAAFRLDVVLSDAPLGPSVKIKGYSHLLAESELTVFSVEALAGKHRKDFPRSLDGAPMYLPTDDTAMRRSLEQFFHQNHVRPRLVGEFEDSALLKTFGQDGRALFPGPSIVEEEVCRQFGVVVLGHIPAIRERYYAITVDRKIKHPAVLKILDVAKKELQG